MQKVSFKNTSSDQERLFKGNNKNIQEGVDKKNNSKTQQILDFYLQKFENHLKSNNSELFENFYNEKQFINEEKHPLNDQQDKGDHM